jgi:hypothetical protein
VPVSVEPLCVIVSAIGTSGLFDDEKVPLHAPATFKAVPADVGAFGDPEHANANTAAIIAGLIFRSILLHRCGTNPTPYHSHARMRIDGGCPGALRQVFETAITDFSAFELVLPTQDVETILVPSADIGGKLTSTRRRERHLGRER